MHLKLLLLGYVFVALILGVNVAQALRTDVVTFGDLVTPTQVSLLLDQRRQVSEDRAVLDVLESWRFEPGYTDAWLTDAPVTSRPLYRLQLETDGTREGRVYVWVFGDRHGANVVYPAIWTYERMFGDHADPDLRNHPDVGWFSMDATWLDAFLAAMRG